MEHTNAPKKVEVSLKNGQRIKVFDSANKAAEWIAEQTGRPFKSVRNQISGALNGRNDTVSGYYIRHVAS